MWVVVGLGNPGRRYGKTRHNVGFMVVDVLAKRYGIPLRERGSYRAGKGVVEGDPVILVEPVTFMNGSGLAVRDVLQLHNAEAEDLIVIHDDIDMEPGKLKIRKKGSSGGHKGVESIIREIGTKEFKRVKVGIGKSEHAAVEDYVLGKFSKDETLLMNDAIAKASDSVVMIIGEGLQKAMNTFN